MKRGFESISSGDTVEDIRTNKVVLVERGQEPGVTLVNALRTSKKSYVELMELENTHHNGEIFIQANAKNKLDVIGKQMKNLQELMNDVISETRLNYELNNAACNFVKKPGQVYHLYERPSGQKYFSMLSLEEWVNAPHQFLGSFRLELDQSWTPIGEEETRFEGINYLRDIFAHSTSSGLKAILGHK